jgi:hypothetical protein
LQQGRLPLEAGLLERLKENPRGGAGGVREHEDAAVEGSCEAAGLRAQGFLPVQAFIAGVGVDFGGEGLPAR